MRYKPFYSYFNSLKYFNSYLTKKIIILFLQDNSSIKLVINKKVFNCTLCRKKFINISQLENHLAKHKKKTTVKKNTYKCDICGKMFHLNFTLNRHLKKLHSSTKLNVQSNK